MNMEKREKAFDIWILFREIMVALLEYLSILIVGLLIDLGYKGIIRCTLLTEIIDALKWIAHVLGISYSAANGVLSDNLGILVTFVGLMITVGIHIVTRSENKLYGIPRLKWEEKKRAGKYRRITRMFFLSPVLLFVAVNCGFCVTGYMIVVFGYAFLAISYFRFSESFNSEKNEKMAVKKLVDIADSDDNKKLKEYLEIIAAHIEKGKNMAAIGYLFEEMFRELTKKSLEIQFASCCSFFQTIYMRNDLLRYHGLEIIENHIYMLEDRGVDNEMREREYMMIWAMMSCIFSNSYADIVNEFVDWCIELPKKNHEPNLFKTDISFDTYVLLLGMLLLQIECMYRMGNCSLCDCKRQLPVIRKYGLDIMGNKFEALREKIRQMSIYLNQRYQICMLEGMRILGNKENIYKGQSIVFNLYYIS